MVIVLLGLRICIAHAQGSMAKGRHMTVSVSDDTYSATDTGLPT